MKAVFDIQTAGREQREQLGTVPDHLANCSHARRTMALPEVANMAAFFASDQASGLTGRIVRITDYYFCPWMLAAAGR